MLKELLLVLKEIPYGQSEVIDFAKGRYKFPKTWKEIKRQAQWQSKK